MNAAERQALRDKHVCKKFINYCAYCGTEYPCDAIKVLDATEPAGTDIQASGISDEMPVNECDHTTLDNNVVRRWWFYCPKCQEMLYS